MVTDPHGAPFGPGGRVTLPACLYVLMIVKGAGEATDICLLSLKSLVGDVPMNPSVLLAPPNFQ